VISYVAEDFGIDLIEVMPVDTGVDRAARNIRATSATGTYAIKWTSGGSTAGLVVPSLQAGQGVTGVTAPVRAATAASGQIARDVASRSFRGSASAQDQTAGWMSVSGACSGTY
jgi:spectinomycin phosphotransferase